MSTPPVCAVERSLALVGERWSLLIVREALDGATRFSEFRDRLGIASNLLTRRLNDLTATGIFDRVEHREPGDRMRHRYHLTATGQALRPVLVALLEWGDEFAPHPAGPSIVVRHGTSATSDCNAPVKLALECAAGHHDLSPREIWRAPRDGGKRDLG